MAKLFLTGASGFLGSHIAATWLRQRPTNTVAALVRAPSWGDAADRLRCALRNAFHEQGGGDPCSELLSRAVAIPGDLLDGSWAAEAAARQWWGAAPGGVEVVHCAAFLSFRAEDRDSLFQINVDGTRRLLDALATLPRPRAVNQVSTAYVSGGAEGVIAERAATGDGFNNHYEHSKSVSERLVQGFLQSAGVPYRIFRPSIIIGHSVTHRVSSDFGFYKVLATLNHLARVGKAGGAPIALPFKREATLDLIPVDIVVEELLNLVGAGPATHGKVFHLTNERPLTVADVFFGIAPLVGLTLQNRAGPNCKRSALDTLVTRGIRHYLPYLTQAREFDRSNVRAHDAGRAQASYRLDLVRLREFAEAYLARGGADQAAAAPRQEARA